MYRVLLAEATRRFYEKADANLQRKLDRCFRVLGHDPQSHANIKPLKGQLKGYYRYRAGEYRVIYRIENDRLVVYVVAIVHRSKAYS